MLAWWVFLAFLGTAEAVQFTEQFRESSRL
jgi:hypothetical protein